MNEKRWWFVAVGVLGISLLWFSGCEKVKGQAPSVSKDVVATVNNHIITEADVDTKISRMPAYYQQILKDRRKELVDDMVLECLLYDEAKKRNLQNDKEVRDLLEEAQRKVLITKLLKEEIDTKTAISDKEVADYYNANKDKYIIPERWRASHILVKTEPEAKAVLAELSKGKVFEEAAKAKSQDTTAERGGDIGYFSKGQLTPEFEEAALKLSVGQTSGVVKTNFGYHIIKLTDHQPQQVQELKEVSARIKNDLMGQRQRDSFNKLVAELKKKANIKINEDAVKPQPAASPRGEPAVKPQPAATPEPAKPEVNE